MYYFFAYGPDNYEPEGVCIHLGAMYFVDMSFSCYSDRDLSAEAFRGVYLSRAFYSKKREGKREILKRGREGDCLYG